MMLEEKAERRRLQKNAASKAWAARNPEKVKAKNAALSKEYKNAARAAYRAANLEKVNAATKKWASANQAHLAQYTALRRQTEPLFKLQNNLSTLAGRCFKLRGWGKTTKTQELLGCTFEEFAVHLQKQFKEGMTLENHGDWHIDHIKPCATATSAEELAALFHFTNLQPLWASENLSKGCKYHGNEQRT